MRFLLPLVAIIAALASPGSSDCMSCQISDLLDAINRLLQGAPKQDLNRECDGTLFPCLSDLQFSVTKLGAYLDGSCDDCDVTVLVRTITVTLQIHFDDSNPYGDSSIGCGNIDCWIHDAREILVNLLGDLGYFIVDEDSGCHLRECQLRSVFLLLRQLLVFISEFKKPREFDCASDWNCILRRLCGMGWATRKYQIGDQSFSVPHYNKTAKSLPDSCSTCVEKKGCASCTKLFNCKCK